MEEVNYILNERTMSTLVNTHIEIPNRLSEAIKNNKLILFIGAGLSKNKMFANTMTPLLNAWATIAAASEPVLA